jgi:hypothetical protein
MGGMDWTNDAQNWGGGGSRVLVNAEMNLQVPKNEGISWLTKNLLVSQKKKKNYAMELVS